MPFFRDHHVTLPPCSCIHCKSGVWQLLSLVFSVCGVFDWCCPLIYNVLFQALSHVASYARVWCLCEHQLYSTVVMAIQAQRVNDFAPAARTLNTFHSDLSLLTCPPLQLLAECTNSLSPDPDPRFRCCRHYYLRCSAAVVSFLCTFTNLLLFLCCGGCCAFTSHRPSPRLVSQVASAA